MLLIVHPFVHRELRLSFAVSPVFAAAFADATGGTQRLFPIDPKGTPRTAPSSDSTSSSSPHPPPTPSIAFNGRVHSTTLAALLGTSSRLVAVDHWNATVGERTCPYPSDALYYALDVMETQGYRVALVKTDAASLCEPYGFVHPLTATLGNVLLADVLGFDAVYVGSRLTDVQAFGEVSRHRVGKGSLARTETRIGKVSTRLRVVSFKEGDLWVDAPPRTTTDKEDDNTDNKTDDKTDKTQHTSNTTTSEDNPSDEDNPSSSPTTTTTIKPTFTDSHPNTSSHPKTPTHHSHHTHLPFWTTLFRAVGLTLNFPLCGASDTCIVKLLHDRHYWDHAHYCLYARPRFKCGACIECVYYDTLHQVATSASTAQGIPPSLFSKTWARCTDQFPEAITSVMDLSHPNRWHLFWMALVTRRDAMPTSANVNRKTMDVLYAYARVYMAHRFGLHAGMMGMLGGVDEGGRGRVVEGWRRLFGVGGS